MNDIDIINTEADMRIRKGKALKSLLNLASLSTIEFRDDELLFIFWFDELTEKIQNHIYAFRKVSKITKMLEGDVLLCISIKEEK